MTEQSTATFCAQHPTVATGLRCGKCERPICPRCLVHTPVGARCAECARLRKLPVFEVGPAHVARAALAGLAVGAVGGLVLPFLPTVGFFGGLIVGGGLGLAVGAAVERAANRKRGTILVVTAALSSVIGPMVGLAALLFWRLPGALPVGERVAGALTMGAEVALERMALLLVVAALVAASRTR